MKEEEFKILDEREHILLRPNMYIGSTSEESISGFFGSEYKTLKIIPGILKIIDEILDNSLDEFIRTSGKFANKISLSISEKKETYAISIRDNGRGMPVKKQDGEYIPVSAWTKPRAGSNFSDDENRITVGMNGVGSFCTNVFSTKFTGETSDGENKLIVKCSNNGLVDFVNVTKSKEQYTEVTFIPDSLQFERRMTSSEIEVIENRIKNLAMCFPEIQFKFNKRVVSNNPRTFAKTFGSHSILNKNNYGTLIITESGKDEELRIHSYVNGIHIKKGGSHIDFIIESVVEHLRPLIKRKYKIDILPNNIKQHLSIISFATGIKNLKFDSQTKERITNTKKSIEEYFIFDFQKIAKQIINTEEIIEPIIEAMLAKKLAADKAALLRANKKNKKIRIDDHLPALSNDPSEKYLFIAEGQSAMGPLASVRDSKIHGGYPLRGKVLNTRDMNPVDIIKNVKISELMGILGISYGTQKHQLNYDHIVIMTDSDVDGSSIGGLLLNFFSEWPALIKNNVYRLITPRYFAEKKGKDTLLFYTKDELDNKKLDNTWSITYAKGLGTLTEDVYRQMINEPKLMKFTCDTNDLESLEMAFGSDAEVRKEWLKE